MLRKREVYAFFAISVTVVGLCSPTPAFAFWKEARRKVHARNPKVAQRVLLRDQDVFRQAYPKIRTYYVDRGLDETRAQEAVTDAWSTYRNVHGSGELGIDQIVGIVTSYGLLILSTDPSGAEVRVDNDSWPRTPTEKMVPSGTRTVYMQKDGYQPVKENVQVLAGEETKVSRTLRPRS